ncbi:MAG: c-type cytochrome [Bacteroidota bacterium]
MNTTISPLLHRILFVMVSILVVASCQQPPTDPRVSDDEKDRGIVLKGEQLNLQAGFKAELLYSPSEEGMGSWVSLNKDEQGRLIASDQYGGLYRITPPPIGDPSATIQVDSMKIPLGHAHGLLWAYNSLYVVVNADEGKGIEGNSSGFYRVFDSDGDGELDDFQHLKTFDGHGEHGPHAVIPSPDNKFLYVLGGNHTELPENYTSRIPSWDTDNLMPTIPDPRGHAIHRPPPGTWIARTDSVGSFWEIVSVGYRNPFDITFNEHGELLTFDSDMEWDLGMPWYRPVRVCHVTSGSEYGWRKGSGKWPEYYPDNLPPIANIGQGCPTGVIIGTGAAYPAKFQHGLFVFDWSFGTMYFVNLEEDGSTYQGEVEEFLSGVPLPLTDGVIGDDGAMYFATGGRRLASGLYRITYTGSEDTSPAPLPSSQQKARDIRREMEALHGNPDPSALADIWVNLSHKDRFIRFAARTALEGLPVSSWMGRLAKERHPHALTEAAIALAHQGSSSDRDMAMNALNKVSWSSLNEAGQLALLRAYGLVAIRLGEPEGTQKNQLIKKLDAAYPASTAPLNRELAYLLSALNAPSVIDKTLGLMKATDTGKEHAMTISEALAERSDRYGKDVINMLKNMPPTQEIAYALALSQVTEGWTKDSREEYFQWFFEALGKEGGMSYRGFIDAIRNEAMKNIPEDEKEFIAELSGQFEPKDLLADLPKPKGPGKAYNPREVRSLWSDALKAEKVRDFAHGKEMFAATLCASCHTMRGEGNPIGPDLTQIGTRFSVYDLALAMTSPSVEISDQYAYTAFTLSDGSLRVGRVVEEDESIIRICANPYTPDQLTDIAVSDVSKREPSKVSPMPPGLIYSLNEEELLDLIAYLIAGGDAEHEYF